jgi:transposase-like protein
MITRWKFTPEFKAQVGLEMLTEQKSSAHASREYGIKGSDLPYLKQELIDRTSMLFQ